MINHDIPGYEPFDGQQCILSEEEALVVARAVIKWAGPDGAPDSLIELALTEVSAMVTAGALAELVLRGLLLITVGDDGKLRYGIDRAADPSARAHLN